MGAQEGRRWRKVEKGSRRLKVRCPCRGGRPLPRQKINELSFFDPCSSSTKLFFIFSFNHFHFLISFRSQTNCFFHFAMWLNTLFIPKVHGKSVFSACWTALPPVRPKFPPPAQKFVHAPPKVPAWAGRGLEPRPQCHEKTSRERKQERNSERKRRKEARNFGPPTLLGFFLLCSRFFWAWFLAFGALTLLEPYLLCPLFVVLVPPSGVLNFSILGGAKFCDDFLCTFLCERSTFSARAFLL